MDEYQTGGGVMAIQAGYDNSSHALDQLAANRRVRRQTTREQIAERILALQTQIEKHQRVLQLLDANAGLEAALDGLREIGI